MSSLFDIGLSGVAAVKNAMYLTANNIANANNPFYCRRTVNFIESSPGLFGSGVNLGDVQRITNRFLDNQMIRANSDASKSSLLSNNFKSLETVLDNEETNVSNFINNSLTALEALNLNPSAYEGRNHFLESLKNLSNRINSVSQVLQQEQINTKTALNQKANEANTLLQQIQELNKKITSSSSENKLFLLDQKDEMLHSLGELIAFKVIDHGSDGIEITLDNGISLLNQYEVASFSIENNLSNPGQMDICLKSGKTDIPLTSIIRSGEIPGLLDYNNHAIKTLDHKLNKLATSIAYTLNQQNKLGIDAQGNLGGNIFNEVNDPNLTQKRSLASISNQGNAQISVEINKPQDLTESSYQIIFDTPNHYNLIRLEDNVIVNNGPINNFPSVISTDGFSINIANANVSEGDSYLIDPTIDFASQLRVTATEGRKIALGFPIIGSPNPNNIGTGKITISAITDTENASFSLPKKLNPPIKITFINDSTYQILDATNNTVIADNVPYDPYKDNEIFPTINGWDPGYRTTLSGTINAGDTFTLDYNQNGNSDNRNGLLFSKIFLDGSTDRNQLNFTQSYQDFLFKISVLANESQINQKVADNFQNQLQSMHDQVSGVSLEEETMNLSRLQEFYLANAQVLETAKMTMDSIFSLFRG